MNETKYFSLALIKLFAINWYGPASEGWEDLVKNHKEEILNLDNKRWWRSQHTPEEIEMRKHPNRGPRWIGNRLTKVKGNLQNKMLDLVIGSAHHLDITSVVGNLSGHRVPCMLCGLTDNEWWTLNQTEWNKRLSAGSSWFGIPWTSHGHCPSCAENLIWPTIWRHWNLINQAYLPNEMMD